MKYCLAWTIFVVQSATLASQYCADALAVEYPCHANLLVAVRTIALGTSSHGAAGLLNTK